MDLKLLINVVGGYMILVMLGSSSAYAQIPITLEQAINTALANSLDIDIAKVDQEIAANNNTWKAAGQHPTITSSLGSTNTLINQDNPTSFLGKAAILNNGLNGNVDIGVNLYDGGRIKINKALFEKQSKIVGG